MNRRRILPLWLGWAVVIVGLLMIPGSAPALVNPVAIIQQQILKPNMLIVFDTSTSMMSAPGNNEMNFNEVGMDCDDGDEHCRQVGQPGRCFFTSAGAMGAGVDGDYTSCLNDAQCRIGYCRLGSPVGCSGDADCDTSTCRGYCSNNQNQTCNGDAACGGGTCRGICNSDWSLPKCTSDANCPAGEWCNAVPYDFCSTAATGPTIVKMCMLGQNKCRTNADCTAIAGDTCGNASSRLVIAKRAVSSIVSSYYNNVNFGLMTFYQSKYYPYYPVSGSIVNHTVTRFLDRDQLKAVGCWTKNDGPASTCKINEETYNRRGSNDTRYKIKTGGNTFINVDSNWCGVWCALPASGGTGYYLGSYYTYTDPQAALASTTPLIQTTYQGKTITVSGQKYVYWTPPSDQRNNDGIYAVYGSPLPIGQGVGFQTQCDVTSGGRGDSAVAPFMDTTNDATKAQDMVEAIMLKMDKAGLGGVAARGFTPSGCTLAFDNAANADYTNNALSYMQKVKSTDTLSCRQNYVLFVTDGLPNCNTSGCEDGCDGATCAAADPTAAGCTCQSVRHAQKLKDAGVKVYVVGFSGSLAGDTAVKTMNNIAKAGGTGTAYFATTEAELRNAMTNAIYDAAKGSYSTSPASSSSGVQTSTAIQLGTMLLDTRVDFPGWKGQLIAYETSSGTPAVAWSAATVAFDATADPDFWKKRNLWTSNGTTMVHFDVNQTTGAITNKATLSTLGLGVTADEAERVAKWLLGDPSMKNPAVLGALVNSTPIDVGPPGNSPLPGGKTFYDTYVNRPNLTYVGSSDGMLHAFFTKDVTVGGNNYRGGQEAFAYIPQSFLQVANKLWAQSGQLPDPKDHIYGLANSPKVKSICTANCDGSSGTPVWKTVLAMAYGFGGTEAFVLDVTNPFDGNGVKSSTAPAPLLWNTQYMSNSTTSAYDNALGLTTSVPAFYYAKGSSKDDFRLIFGSYYTDTSNGQMGKVLLTSSVRTGALVDSQTINPGNQGCAQEFGLLSDVATARNFAVSEETQIAAAYFGDTWGNLYRYVPSVGSNNYTGTSGSVSTVQAYGCQQPIHYAPAVVQLDRDNPSTRPGEIYIVQATNSALDDETKNYPASKLIIRRDLLSGSGTVTNDTTFATITLNAGVQSELCGVTNAAGTSCTETLPTTARPNATPLAVLKQDGTGFQILATWYKPAVDPCNKGVTYLTIHEVNVGTGAVSQKFAMKLASEPVTSVVFVGGKLMFASETGVTDLTSVLPSTVKFVASPGGGTAGAAERFRRLSWTEVP